MSASPESPPMTHHAQTLSPPPTHQPPSSQLQHRPPSPSQQHPISPDSPMPISTDSGNGDSGHSPSPRPGGIGPESSHSSDSGEEVVVVTCGLLRAKLHLNRFMCPGIHQACIEYQGEFYTPKQFTVVAAKDKQKDWKGSIKMNRVPMRTLMERKQIDFYSHETYCSGKCASKNYRALFKDAGDQFFQGGEPAQAQIKPEAQASVDFLNTLSALQARHQALVNAATATPSTSAALSASIASSNPLDFGIGSLVRSNLEGHQRLSSPKMQLLEAQLLEAQNRRHQARDSSDETRNLIHSKPVEFWEGVATLGMFRDLVEDLAARVAQLRSLYNTRPDQRHKIAEKLSRVVVALEAESEIAGALNAKRMIVKAETDNLSTELEELRRRTEEQRRKALEAKRKSEIFDQLLLSAAKVAKLS